MESAGDSLRHLGSTSSSKSEEESTGHDERKLSAAGALHATVAPLLSAQEEDSHGVSVERDPDADSVFESGSEGAGSSEKRALVLVITSDDKLEITLTPGAVETLYEFEKVSLVTTPTSRIVHLIRL